MERQQEIMSVFAYVALRPDNEHDIKRKPYTKDDIADMKYEMAYLKDVKMYRDRKLRAATVPGEVGEITKGWVLSTDDADLWVKKLARFDQREGYAKNRAWNAYERIEYEAYIFEDEEKWNAVKSTEDIENNHSTKRTVYLYKMDDCTKDEPIEGGDWLTRHIDIAKGFL